MMQPTALPNAPWSAPTHVVTDNGTAMRCARGGCETRIPVKNVAADRRVQLAKDHGWIEVDGAVYCSRRCHQLYRANPTDSHVHRVHVAAERPSDKVTRVSVRDMRRGDGSVARSLICDWDQCQDRGILVARDASADEIIRVARANGWQQTSVGTFCCGDHAKWARGDFLAGRSKAKQFGVAEVQVAQAQTGDHVAPEPIALATPVAPADQTMVVHAPQPDAAAPAQVTAQSPVNVAPEASRRHRGPRRG